MIDVHSYTKNTSPVASWVAHIHGFVAPSGCGSAGLAQTHPLPGTTLMVLMCRLDLVVFP